MSIRSHRDADVSSKTVLVRVDFNVPLDGEEIRDDTRIQAAVPTIQSLLERGAKLILVSHLGRPKGKPDARFSLAPVAHRLQGLLEVPVQLLDGPVAALKGIDLFTGDRSVVMLENIRLESGEEKNDPELARDLASLADLYVNDAFGAAHRAHASTVGVAHHLPAYAGDLMAKEVEALARLVDEPERPFVSIIGGAKVSDKLTVLRTLLGKVDSLAIGGGMANTFLLASGQAVGSSLAESDLVDEARHIMADAKTRGVRISLPIDVVVGNSMDDPTGTVVNAEGVTTDQSIFDIGPETVRQFGEEIIAAKTIFWNGPMGVFERDAFSAGTIGVARAIAASDAYSVVGGGDSVAALEAAEVADQVSHVSTGGGASLEYVEGRELPGLVALGQST